MTTGMITAAGLAVMGFRPGDRIGMAGKSNRHRFLVRQIVGNSQMSVAEFIRPSKGFARHVRRMKAARKSK
jgi:hypothetical protein